MDRPKVSKLNRLQRELPEGLLVDARWLSDHGYSKQLRSQYVDAGWLERTARSVYRRPRGGLTWEQVVVSLQTVLIKHLPPFVVGGRTALELQGFAHYLSHEVKEVHLYGPQPPPKWLHLLPLSTKFVVHKNNVLFKNEPNTRGLSHVRWNIRTGQASSADPMHGDSGPPGPMDWFMTVSTPERAYLELLDELPQRETFHQADVLMEGMARLSPRRLQALLEDCRSVKVKRLFFFFADRHQHPWRKHLKKDNIDFGQGKRMLVKDGVLDKTYEITVPEELHGPRRQL